MLPVAGAGRAAASAASGPVAAFVGHPVTGAAAPGPTGWPGGLAPARREQSSAGSGAERADQIQMPASGGSTVQLGLCCGPPLPGLSLSGVHGLVDEIKAISHRGLGGGLVRAVLLAGQPGNAMALGFQLGEQHLLMAQTISKQLLIQGAGIGLAPLKQAACFQFLPPRADHRAAGEERAPARS